jgi:hypothetical protein
LRDDLQSAASTLEDTYPENLWAALSKPTLEAIIVGELTLAAHAGNGDFAP